MTTLKVLRQKLGWTQIQVAVRAGVSRETIRKLERGEWETAHVETVAPVAHALGVSVVDLIPALGERPSGVSRRRRGR